MNEFLALQQFIDEYGISDDVARSEKLSSATYEQVSELIKAVQNHEEALDAYFARSDVDSMSEEYIAISATRMAAEEAESSRNSVSKDLQEQRTAEILKAIFWVKKEAIELISGNLF